VERTPILVLGILHSVKFLKPKTQEQTSKQGLQWVNLKERDHLKDLGLGGQHISKTDLNEIR
jgi:hypothetical protein